MLWSDLLLVLVGGIWKVVLFIGPWKCWTLHTANGIQQWHNIHHQHTVVIYCVQLCYFPLCIMRLYVQCSIKALIILRWGGLFACLGFTFYQHSWSYWDGYQLVTMRTDNDFMMQPHWEIRLSAPWPDIPLSYIILILS